ncbi:MAG: selenium metabolism-associated LysR family transcriptional regulator [Thermoleophilia bacterium]|nr:selenium metabolism-associated LysR family transcriptional regulator [Thermoleophilia bacterium]
MDLGHLLTFRIVADRGSFSRAAQELGLSQPAVSNQIRTLEARLGQRLLDRGGRSVEMTPAGEVVYQAALRMLEQQDRLRHDLANISEEVSGRLAIGSSTGPGELLLPRLCAEFSRLYPDVQLALEVHDTQAVCERVLAGRVEIGFVGAARAQRGLAFEAVITDELVLAAPADHLLASRKSVSVEELADIPMLVQQQGSGVRAVVEDALAQKGTSRGPHSVAMEMGLQQSVKAAVLDGLGVTVISRSAIARELEQGALVAVSIVDPPLTRDFHAVWRDGRTLSRASAAFLDFVRDALGPEGRGTRA